MVLLDPKNLYKSKGPGSKHNASFEWDIVHEEGREVISHWRDKRLKVQGARKAYHEFLVHSFDLDTLKSFFQNINFMVVIQMVLAVIAVYLFQKFNIYFDVHVSLFVSPIVFPLAFSINTDFQRREKVLEDLAIFKSSGMVWYFCMREWKQAAELDINWITAVHGKLKSLLFHLREYLLTCKPKRRKIILRAMYEDFSDTNQLIERVRASKLPANTAIVSRSIHLLNMMCLSFERLRVIREYRSPRSIRSFNKVFIMFLPIILSPYFVYLGIKSNNVWEPYYIAVLVAFVFSALQGVQDKLDDPFDGMSEDDIDLDTIDEWTFGSLEHTMKRTFDIGRFKVTVDPGQDAKSPTSSRAAVNEPLSRKTSFTHSLLRSNTRDSTSYKEDHVDIQKIAPFLQGLKGNTRITKKSLYRKSSQMDDEDSDGVPLDTIFEPITINNLDDFQGQLDKKVTFFDEQTISPDSENGSFMVYQTEGSDEPLIPQNSSRINLTDNDMLEQSTHDIQNKTEITLLETPESASEPSGTTSLPRNRFCVKPSAGIKNILPNTVNDVDKSILPKNEDKIKDLITFRENKVCRKDTDEEVDISYPDNRTVASMDSETSLLIKPDDSSHLVDLPSPTSSEPIDIPSVSFISSTSNLNNVPSSETDSKNKGVLSLLKEKTSSYSSVTSDEDGRDEQLEKQISSAF